MTRLVDADEMIVDLQRRCSNETFYKQVKEGLIDCAPTVDAELIVRCKDCKHRGFSECTMYHEEWYDYDDDGYLESDIRVYDYTEDNGFCHKGEREDNSI